MLISIFDSATLVHSVLTNLTAVNVFHVGYSTNKCQSFKIIRPLKIYQMENTKALVTYFATIALSLSGLHQNTPCIDKSTHHCPDAAACAGARQYVQSADLPPPHLTSYLTAHMFAPLAFDC